MRSALRPRDAGTLIILDESSPVPKVLMGRRSEKLVFMPGKYVFPGGRVEVADLRHAAEFSLSAERQMRLLAETTARFDARRAVAVALATIRETFEEVGLAFGERRGFAARGSSWMRFAATGAAPDPAMLAPVARAITPPGPPRRYDTRFFCVSLASAASSLPFAQRPDDEFDHIDWISLDDLGTLDLPRITRQVLGDIDARLRDGTWRDSSLPMPFYRMHRGSTLRDMI